MEKAIAEFIGTFMLVLIGCGAAIFAGKDLGAVGIALAFGLTYLGMYYVLREISGAHLNPAISLGMLVAERMDPGEFLAYVLAQCLGAILAVFVLYLIWLGKMSGVDPELGFSAYPNGWGAGFGGEYNGFSAFFLEMLMTILLVMVYLGATEDKLSAVLAGFAVGGMLIALHLAGHSVTGTSVNPARSLGSALFSGTGALSQLWLFILAPVLGALIAGLLFRSGLLSSEVPGMYRGDGSRWDRFGRSSRSSGGAYNPEGQEAYGGASGQFDYDERTQSGSSGDRLRERIAASQQQPQQGGYEHQREPQRPPLPGQQAADYGGQRQQQQESKSLGQRVRDNIGDFSRLPRD